MSKRLLLLLAAALSGIPSPAAAQETGSLSVLSLQVKFGRETDAGVRGSIALDADVPADAAVASFDPAVDSLRVTVGPAVLFDGPPHPGRASLGGKGTSDVSLRLREPWGRGSRARFRMIRASGRIALRASGVDLTALRDAGPGQVPVTIRIGDADFATSLDLDGTDPRRWASGEPGFEPPPLPPGGTPASWSYLLQGSIAAATVRKTVVARSGAEYIQIWTGDLGGSPGENQLPAVDFSRDMVVGVFYGQWWDSSRRPEIGTVEIAGDGMRVTWLDVRYSGGLDVVLAPYCLARVPRVEGNVEFVSVVQYR